ncbi:HMG-Y-related protein A-like [Triticum urartu]|uniref:H15 domain-containing protein n=1 Tax=Triticum urartu TaxID=4572 RepID=A0A8R7QEG1_TRIUA|nr:HMG-Y-related protein A-like [Triticum urartu]
MANDGSPKSGDIPPYPEMIIAAIEALGDKNGSSKSAISSYIEEKYEGLPSAHASLLTANLASMKEAGKLSFVKNNYLKADAPSATPAKRGRGRPPKDPNAPPKPKAAPKDPNTPKRGRGRPPKVKDPMADAVKEAVAKATTGMPRGRGRPPGPSSAKKAKVATEAASPAPGSGSAPAKRGRGRPRKVAV